jgi:hypothetical protein
MEKRESPLNQPEIIIFPSRSFYFDPGRREFIVGNSTEKQVINLSEVRSPLDIESKVCEMKADIGLDNQEMLLLTPFGTLLETPSLRKWLNSLSEEEKDVVSRKTQKIISDVYGMFNPLYKPSKMLPRSYSTHAINALILDHGVFSLHTMGEYATLQRTNHQATFNAVNYRNRDLEEAEETNVSLPTEYGLHNTDFPEQRLSLYAGAGTIAWLAKYNRRDI